MAEAAPRFDAGVRFVSFPERRFPLPALHGASVVAAARAPPCDALVIDSIAAALVAPWLASRRLQIPLVAVVHQHRGGIDHGPLRTAIQTVLDGVAYRRVSGFVAASQSLVDALGASGVARDKIVLVAPGKDVAEHSAEDAGDLRAGRTAAFLCVGNWVRRKGIVDLLDALARLPGGAATLHLVGDERSEPRYARLVRARLNDPALAGRVVSHGTVGKARLAALYAAADVFVLPSYKEPYGTVYGEAMAQGLPVVGWRAGNLPHLARHEQHGLIVEPGDVQGLALALHRLALDQDLRCRLGKAAARRADSFPTWDQSAALFFDSIREVVERP
jgi:glycosyltransferase involved in cell wall biosynthesis